MPKLKSLDDRNFRERSKFSLDRRDAVGSWTWNARRDCVWADSVVAMMFDIDPEEAEAGMPLSVFAAHVHPSDRPRVLAFFRADAQTDGHSGIEYRIRTGDGGLRLVLCRGRFDSDHRGRPLSGRGIIVDITDLQAQDAGQASVGIADEEAPTELLDQAAGAAIAAFQAIGALNDPGLTARAEALLFEIGRKLALQEAADDRSRLN